MNYICQQDIVDRLDSMEDLESHVAVRDSFWNNEGNASSDSENSDLLDMETRVQRRREKIRNRKLERRDGSKDGKNTLWTLLSE